MDFTEYADSQRNLDQVFYVLGKFYLLTEQIISYTFGSWQSSHDVHSCVDGLLKLLGKFDITTRLSQTEIDQILTTEVPEKWSSNRHFSNEKRYKEPLDVRCICGPWYRHGDFVAFVLCQDYCKFFDPLNDEYVIDPSVHENVKNVIKTSYELKRIEVLKLSPSKEFKRICIRNDSSLQNWSCGTFVILTTLRLVLRSKLPHEIKPKSISRRHMLNLRKSLLKWLLHGTPPDVWSIGCPNTSMVDCEPIPLKYKNILGGPWWASSRDTIG